MTKVKHRKMKALNVILLYRSTHCCLGR